ncbi:MAG: glycoside hydrolase family 32 protein [Clostridia bacterium]|nr:glycoside hydrolase family 32 protein [Clostridia bacterium]
MKKILPLLLAAALLAACAPSRPAPDETKGEPAVTDETAAPAAPTEGNALYTEPLRPTFHYTAKDSWINDPNGLVYFKGVYHLSYQTAPGQNVNGAMHWGHAVSEDLVHFTECEPILSPDGSGRMWSGTAWPDPENRSGLFDGVEGGGILAAYSTDRQQIGLACSADGYSYTKLGIVIPNTEYAAFRDPKLFWDELSGRFTMVVAGGTVRFYQSDDLKNWTCVSVNEAITTECPDFFPMTVEGTGEQKWVLTCAGRYAYVGSWDGTRFTPETGKITLNCGPDAYAGITFSSDKKDRRLMISWQNNWSYSAVPDGIWNGAMTVVTELTLQKNGSSYTIAQTPAEEYASLEGKTLAAVADRTLSAGETLLDGVFTNVCRVRLEIDRQKTTDFTLTLCRGEGEGTVLSYEKTTGRLLFDRSASLTGLDAMKRENALYSIPAGSAGGETLTLDLLLDVSCAELFTGGGTAFSARIQPLSSSRGMSLTTEGSLAIRSLTVTEMKNARLDSEDPVDAVHASAGKIVLAADGAAETVRPVCAYDGSDRFTAESLDPAVCTAEKEGLAVRIRAVGAGETQVRLLSGSRYLLIPVTVLETGAPVSDLAAFTLAGATLESRPDGYLLTPMNGDGFALGDVWCEDADFSAVIRPQGEKRAAALMFRASDTKNFYCLCADFAAGVVKIWMKQGGVSSTLVSAKADFTGKEEITLRAVCRGELLEGYLGGKKIVSVKNGAHRAGVVGLNAFRAPALFNEILLAGGAPQTAADFPALRAIAGTVGRYGAGAVLSCPGGDGFAVSEIRAADFTCSADITLTEGTPAGAILFRWSQDNFYVATLDAKAGVLKLWKRTEGVTSVVSTAPVSVKTGETHTLTVEAAGAQITLSLDGVKKLRAADRSHTDGLLGFNVFRGSAVFGNFTCSVN